VQKEHDELASNSLQYIKRLPAQPGVRDDRK
jgi:hypothetical protein